MEARELQNEVHDGQPGEDFPDDQPQGIYEGMFQNLNEKWLAVQLTHNVSASATNAFWEVAFQLVPELMQHKRQEMVEKKIPGFIHLRRKLYDRKCPKVEMKFVYLNKNTQEIEVVNTNKNPRLTYNKANYVKLYEEAHVKVIKYFSDNNIKVCFRFTQNYPFAMLE